MHTQTVFKETNLVITILCRLMTDLVTIANENYKILNCSSKTEFENSVDFIEKTMKETYGKLYGTQGTVLIKESASLLKNVPVSELKKLRISLRGKVAGENMQEKIFMNFNSYKKFLIEKDLVSENFKTQLQTLQRLSDDMETKEEKWACRIF